MYAEGCLGRSPLSALYSEEWKAHGGVSFKPQAHLLYRDGYIHFLVIIIFLKCDRI